MAKDTHHTVSARILDAVGRGFLIATAGVVAGAMFGTANLTAIGVWTTVVAAASGVACMICSALVNNAGCDRGELDGGGSPEVANVRQVMAAMPGVEVAENIASEERWARRMASSNQQRQNGSNRGA